MNNDFFNNVIQEGNKKIERAKEILELQKENFMEAQNNFLKSNLGQAINAGIDIGLQALLPDVIEDEVIAIKDSLITEGFSAAINTAIEESINLGKSTIGIITGTFENVSQIKKAIKSGGLIDSISEVLNSGIKWIKEKGYVKKGTANAIKKGKDTIIKIIDKNVGNELENQIEAIDKINGYIEKWHRYYEERNFSNMEYQYKKIEENLEKVIPLEDVLTKARQVENLHELIKNNGKNFDLSEEEKNLANMLVK